MTARVAPGLHVVLGAGPIGRAVASELLNHEGTNVRIVSRRGWAAKNPRMEGLAADLSDPAAAIAACSGAATVTFAVAPPYTSWPQDFPALQEAAIRGAAEAGAVLVAVENLYGYGRAGRLRESDVLSATTRKGRVRAEMSARLMAAHADGTVRATAGRASDLFGPGMAVSALGERVWPQLLQGRAISWIGDPDVPHTFSYLPDFARALVRLGAEPQAWGRAWHIPSPPDRTLREVLEDAARLGQTPPPRVRRMPSPVLKLLSFVSPLLREVEEMAYQFEAPFHMDTSDYAATFGDKATAWNAALGETLTAWREAG
ncbi:MAG: NAD-dependent epimerase [Pseudomonadota bacterium]